MCTYIYIYTYMYIYIYIHTHILIMKMIMITKTYGGARRRGLIVDLVRTTLGRWKHKFARIVRAPSGEESLKLS